MNTYHTLVDMEKRMFTEALFNSLYAEYQVEVDTFDYRTGEQELQEGHQALQAVLDSALLVEIKDLEDLCLQYAKDVVSVAFRQGNYTGFQQYFTKDTEKQPYSSFLRRRETRVPHALSVRELFAIDALEKKYEAIEERLPEDLQSRLLDVFLTWRERIDAVMRHSFYLGYRYAHITIEKVECQVDPTMRIVDKKLLTEFDLGLIQLREQEEV